MSASYRPVSQTNSTFGSPRQKTWIVMKLTDSGWVLALSTNSLIEAQSMVKTIMSSGGLYNSNNINNVMLAELVPIDIAITPQV